MELYPLTFHPIYKERVWGGRRLAELYGKGLPEGLLIGEAWEICDRAEEVSVVANGPLAGKDLRWLMEQHARSLLGTGARTEGRFPWLIKLLDAEEDLSLQVHPPAHLASGLGGEPKTEFWYIAEARPGACLHAGLKQGVTRDEFYRQASDGTVAGSFHRHALQPGDAMFLPSGRVHALGAGCVVFEIQQNSDTTYRVFDWNRRGLDGRPRALHLEQAMAAIHFDDFEPDLIRAGWEQAGHGVEFRALVTDPLFHIRHYRVDSTLDGVGRATDAMTVIGMISGQLRITGGGETVRLTPGSFALIPAAVGVPRMEAKGLAEFLQVIYPGTR